MARDEKEVTGTITMMMMVMIEYLVPRICAMPFIFRCRCFLLEDMTTVYQRIFIQGSVLPHDSHRFGSVYILVGFITDSVTGYMDALKSQPKCWKKITVILGWNEATARCVVQMSFLRRQYQMLNESQYPF